MYRILTAFLFLSPFLAKGQTHTSVDQGATLYKFKNGLKVDSALFLPRKDTVTADLTMRAPGMIVYRPQDSLLYYRKGNAMTPVSTGGGDLSNYYTKSQSDTRFVHYTDTSLMLVPYLRKSDTSSMLSPYLRKTDTAGMLNNYYTKTELQTAGQAAVHWGNLTNITDAEANGEVKGIATFDGNQFDDDGAGAISLDTVNGPNWTKTQADARYPLNTRIINTTSPLQGGGNLTADRTISILNAAADGSTKGAASFTASDFNSSAGNISIDYTNGQAASGVNKGFLTAADWTAFNNKLTSLNGLTGPALSLVTGTSGTDFNISPSGSTITLNLPSASQTARGAVTTGSQSFAGAKTFNELLTVRRNMNSLSGPIVSIENSGSSGGDITLGNATILTGFLPIIAGTVKQDTTDPLVFRNMLIQSKYNSIDTTGKSDGDKSAIASSGGVQIVASNLNHTYTTPTNYDNVFGILKASKNLESDSTVSSARNNYLLRVDGAGTLQSAGKIAIGYPFTNTLGKVDDINLFKNVPSGNAAIFNGRVSGFDAVSDSDYVTYRQYAYANVKAYGATGNGVTDDAAAFVAAFATGKPVFVPKGTFLLNSTITMPLGSTITGVGVLSILKTTSNAAVLYGPSGYVTIKDLRILGSGRGTATPYATNSPNQHGIHFTGATAKNIVENVLFQQMGGAGVYAINNQAAGSNYEGNQIVACKMEDCWAGFYADAAGEYNLLSVPTISRCEYGIYNKTGNNSVTGGNITACRTGIFISTDAMNDGHCGSSNVKINHSIEYSVRADNVTHGYFFDGCIFTLADVYINTSNSIKFTDCEIYADTIFAQAATRSQFINTRWRKTPVYWLSFNGTNNSGSASDVQFFNSTWEAALPTGITFNSLAGSTSINGTSVFPLSMSRTSFGDFSFVLTSDPMGLGAALANNSITLKNNTATGDIAFASNNAAQPNLVLKQSGNTGIGLTAPTSTFHVTGSEAHTVTAISSNTTLGAHNIVEITTGSITVTLPTASTCSGRVYEIRNRTASTCTITSVDIDGVGTTTFPANTYWKIVSNGSAWRLIARSN